MTTMLHKFYPSAARKQADEAKRNVAPVVIGAAGDNERIFTKASKLGLTVSEYMRRCTVVQMESNRCKWQAGDKVYPHSAAEFKKHGVCFVVHVVRNYDDYGTVEWHEPPFIVSVAPAKGGNSTINCTANWVQASPPTDKGTSNEC